MSTLQGKRVWITGASSGIGAALAVECRLRGALLVLSARDAGKLGALADSLPPYRTTPAPEEANAAPRETLVVPMNVENGEEIKSAVQRVASQAGPVDVIIHAAGVSQRATGMETENGVLRRIFETNFFSIVTLSRDLLLARDPSGGLHIVVITSSFAKFGAPGRSAYAASKHALHGYFDSLRAELPPDRVHITMVVAGAIATNISLNALRGDGTRHAVNDRAIARGMSAERCAKKIVRAIERNRREMKVGTGFRLRIVYVLRLIAPGLLARALRSARIT